MSAIANVVWFVVRLTDWRVLHVVVLMLEYVVGVYHAVFLACVSVR